MQHELPIRPRTKNDDLVTWIHLGTTDKLVVCFSGIGENAEACPPFEFAQTATGNGAHNVLFVADPNRTWLNGPDLIERIRDEVETVANDCNASRVVAMGHSMGGFSALVLPGFTSVDEVLAFAPQISVHPDIVPDETRWANHREKIKRFKIISAADHFQDQTKYTVIHGRHGREAPQRDRFPSRDNLRHFILPQTHHNVPQRLKSSGCLHSVVSSAIDGRPRKLRLHLQNTMGAKLRQQK